LAPVKARTRASPVTLRNVAALAGVHYSTASKALDPSKKDLVSAATRARVQTAAEDLGYRPHLPARALRRGKTGTVGVVLADIGNPYIPGLVRGLAGVFEAEGVLPIIFESEDDSGRLARILDALAGQRVDGVIVACARRGDENVLLQFAQRIAPVVLAIRRLPGSGLPAVCADDLEGGRLAGGYLLRLRHRRLAQLQGPQDIQPFADRGLGFNRAVEDAGVVVVNTNDYAVHPTYEEGARLMNHLIATAAELPTGVFAQNDSLALGAIDALRSCGLECPNDVSIIGFNDNPYTHRMSPPLSTVRISSYEIGALASKELCHWMEGAEGLGSEVFLPPSLVARGSTKRVNRLGS
jgi:LacI family transcriptional regulator